MLLFFKRSHLYVKEDICYVKEEKKALKFQGLQFLFWLTLILKFYDRCFHEK